jgi:hypothetical protein
MLVCGEMWKGEGERNWYRQPSVCREDPLLLHLEATLCLREHFAESDGLVSVIAEDLLSRGEIVLEGLRRRYHVGPSAICSTR